MVATMDNDFVKATDESAAALLAAYRLLLEAGRRRRGEGGIDLVASSGATAIDATGRPVEEVAIEEGGAGRPVNELYRQGAD